VTLTYAPGDLVYSEEWTCPYNDCRGVQSIELTGRQVRAQIRRVSSDKVRG
jgi:hypothetical protein